ncbi:hypothetical protein N656DRAFT_783225 [Canariomyces notabilis]|uniref:Uncharacterized protein n=1 Tax=Canariomyces notabilis TaxID=2074819 RepID=A0AAN6T9Z5_9PEZI|nr:hypothetical protein N656DRAFT_783225 [Canariomyces arenarius]
MPDFYLIDFGQAGYARRYPYYQGDDLRVWDIPDLMNIIETKLFRLTLPIAGPGAVHHHEGLMALLNEQNTSNPICVAYQVLRRLDRQYAINKNLAVTQSRSTQQQPTRLVVPCLDGIINYVAAHATHAEPSLVASGNWRAFNQTYCSLYELGSCPPQPVRRPLLFPTAQELLAIRNVPGPWYVARVDVAVGQYDFRVRKVLDGAHHRPNEDNTDSDTEEAYMWSDEDESGGC